MREEITPQLIDETLPDLAHDVRVVVGKKTRQHRYHECCETRPVEKLLAGKRSAVQPGADEWHTTRLVRKHAVGHNPKRAWPEEREQSVQQHGEHGQAALLQMW